MKSAMSITGVTMMEVMIVVVIIAVASALTIPMLVNYTESNRLKLAAETFYNDAVRARSEAIKSNGEVTISFQTGTSWCYGLTTASSCDCAIANNCPLGQIASSKYKGSVPTLSATGITTSVLIEGDRGTLTPSGTINFISASGDTISVQLNGMGAAQVCSSDVGGYEPC